jgi:hypothetical protein
MDTNIIEKISTLGLGAVIAIILLYWKRNDDTNYSETIKNLIGETFNREAKIIEMVHLQITTMESIKNLIQNLDIFYKLQERLK